MTITQVSEFSLGEETRNVATLSLTKRARLSSSDRDSSTGRCRSHDGSHGPRRTAGTSRSLTNTGSSSSSTTPLSPVPETPRSRSAYASAAAAASAGTGSYANVASDGSGGCYPPPRSGSPTPSYASSSAFSAATTSATSLSSRASLSSCRSSFTSPRTASLSSFSTGRGEGDHHRRKRSSSGRRRSSSSSSISSSQEPFFSGSQSRSPYPLSSFRRGGPSVSPIGAGGGGGGGGGADFFPKPLPLSWGGRGVASRRWRDYAGVGADRRRDGGGGGARDRRSRPRERYSLAPPGRRSGRKDYASEAGGTGSGGRCVGTSSGSGSRKRNRSCSRERRSCSRGRRSASSSSSSGARRRNEEGYSLGVECPRCLERCRPSREPREPITRTLPMDYWVRTPRCKAAKSKHIDFIDDVAYSREQFIEETVFTCPFTGARRDKVLERNMFPYDVPTDVEHWTLWSREDLDDDQMEAFVREWAAENHPHVVEWECDNNEGERSIDWFHVHVFFRVGCEDRTGVLRDPASVYDGPIGSRKREEDEEEEEEEEEEEGAAVVVGNGGGGGNCGLSVEAVGGDDGSVDAKGSS